MDFTPGPSLCHLSGDNGPAVLTQAGPPLLAVPPSPSSRAQPRDLAVPHTPYCRRYIPNFTAISQKVSQNSPIDISTILWYPTISRPVARQEPLTDPDRTTMRHHLPESSAAVTPLNTELRLTGLCLDKPASLAFGKVATPHRPSSNTCSQEKRSDQTDTHTQGQCPTYTPNNDHY